LLAKISFWILIFIGFGSAFMHATLHYWAELFDEGPMLCLMAVYQITWSKLLFPRYANAFAWFICLANLLMFSIYVRLNSYDIFVHGFTVQVVMVCLSPIVVLFSSLGSESLRSMVKAKRFHVFTIIGHILVARIGWELEQQLTNSRSFGDWRGAADPELCTHYPMVHWCHVWWHIQSAYAAYLTIVLLDSVNKVSPKEKPNKSRSKRA
jgi:hypothetical protein